MRTLAILWGALAVLLTSPTIAETIRVPEDFATVSGALGAAVAGDSVLIAIGVFDEGEPIEVGVAPGVVVIGSGWNTISDGTILSDIRLRFLPGSEPASVENLWVDNRRVEFDNANAVLRNCRLGFGNPWSDPSGILMVNGGTIDGCFFHSEFRSGLNTCISIQGGGIVRIKNNVFVTRGDYVIKMPPQNSLEIMELRDNTFFEDLSLDIDVWPTPTAQLFWINNIFSPGPTNLRCSAGTLIQYNVFQGSVGLVACHPIDQTNLLVNPLMCNASWFSEIDGFELNSSSPCLGAGEGGSTIGALGIGCGLTSVGDVSAPGAEKMRLEVVPNPGRSFGALRLSKPAQGPVEIGCWDATGRLIAKRSVGVLLGREMNLKEVLGNLPANPESGVYFFELSSDSERAVTKSLIVK